VSTVVAVSLSEALKESATLLALRNGVSLESFVATALAQRVAEIESAQDFLQREAARASGRGLADFLSRRPDVPPMPGDEIPDDLEVVRENGTVSVRRKATNTGA
jgi:hypothetical protein